MELQADHSEPDASPAKTRRFQTGVRTLVVLVAVCGVVVWAARSVWESQHPAIAAGRGLDGQIPSERVNATRLLAHVGLGDNAVAISALIGALGDPEVEVRVAAAEALQPIGISAITAGTAPDAVRAAITALIGSLKDPRPDGRIAAARALADMMGSNGSVGVIDFEAVFTALTGILGDQDVEIRITAIRGLGATARHLSVEPPAALVAALEDERAEVRAQAVKALFRFQRGLDRSLPSIFRVLDRDAEPRGWISTSNVLNELGQRSRAFSATALPTLITGLSSRHGVVRYWSASLLGVLGPDACPAVPDLIKTFWEPIDSTRRGEHPMAWDPAWAAGYALKKIAPDTASAGEVIQALTEVLRTGHPARRNSAANFLGQFGPAAVAAVPVLVKMGFIQISVTPPLIDLFSFLLFF